MAFVKGFVDLCDEGVTHGWHERNGGNLSYRLRPEEAREARRYFSNNDLWKPLDVFAPNLAGEYFLVTGAGHYLKNASSCPEREVGICELDEKGKSWRLVWGFTKGGTPTSEFSSHVLNHSVRAAATNGACRVLYHAHPTNLVAMTFVVPLTAKDFSQRLWRMMTECVLVFPRGIGVVEWMVPGGPEIAIASSELFRTYDAIVWAHHGLFASGEDFDSTFELMHTIEKSADIYRRARSMNGGSEKFPNTIDDEGLRETARIFHCDLNEALLD